MIQWSDAPQGSDAWLIARRAVITASRFKDARDKIKGGKMSEKAMMYAYDVARERVGGTPEAVYVNQAMRTGTEQEPIARVQYESDTGLLVTEAGFAFTPDRRFGVSVDGLIGPDGLYECKTMVKSTTLFRAVVDGDISGYIDQCEGAMWLLGRQWVDLHLWVPDLPHLSKVIRIERDDDRIEALESDLIAFESLVSKFEQQLRGSTPDIAPVALPETISA